MSTLKLAAGALFAYLTKPLTGAAQPLRSESDRLQTAGMPAYQPLTPMAACGTIF